MTQGTYVLATEYSDGIASDHWKVGFYSEELSELGHPVVVDADGVEQYPRGLKNLHRLEGDIGGYIVGFGAELGHDDVDLIAFITELTGRRDAGEGWDTYPLPKRPRRREGFVSTPGESIRSVMTKLLGGAIKNRPDLRAELTTVFHVCVEALHDGRSPLEVLETMTSLVDDLLNC